MLFIYNYSLVITILLLFCTSELISTNIDPYKVLGVNKDASNQEIKRAFKQLAKEWHPDKNDHPDAEMNFIQIKQAYELLSDNQRRRIYDEHGITDEDSLLFKRKHDYTQYDRFSSDNFELFGNKFYFDHDVNFYHKLSVTTKYYERTIITKSKTTPYILIFYNNLCFRCNLAISAFKKIIETLEPLGIQFATVNAAYEQELYRKVGINDVPNLILVLSGHFYIYRKNSYSTQKVVEFMREKLPYAITTSVKDSNVDHFLQGWMDNRIRALILEDRNQTRLRYLIAAYAFRHRVAFGFVNIKNYECENMLKRYEIRTKLDTLLLFNEDIKKPLASVSMANIPTTTLFNVIMSNLYLALPRLSSQEIFQDICPAEWNRTRKRLCALLITTKSDKHNLARDFFRNLSLQNHYNPDKVRFVYIFKDEQLDFIKAISDKSPNSKLLHVVLIWRRDATHIKYEWIDNVILNAETINNHSSDENIVNNTKSRIYNTIHKLLQNSEVLANEAVIQNLLDEHSQGLLTRWLLYVLYIYDYVVDNIGEEEILAIFSFLGTIIFMFTVGYIMMYFVKIEEENLKTKNQILVSKPSKYTPELKLHELRAEKYNGMVRLLKPGCRTIILITDLQSRPKLVPPFHKAVWSYRKSKTLLFGHMLIEKGLSWYAELLRLSLCETKSYNINPRNCVGTVLAVNGHRKYFCMYHAKHPETARGSKRMRKLTRDLLHSDDPEAGILIESEDSVNSEIEPQILLEDNLLDGLSNWLDRLFEGTTHRYYVNYWPNFCTK